MCLCMRLRYYGPPPNLLRRRRPMLVSQNTVDTGQAAMIQADHARGMTNGGVRIEPLCLARAPG